MASSLKNGPIPAYDPNNSYAEPKLAPRVNGKGAENYLKGRGQLNNLIFSSSQSSSPQNSNGTSCESPRLLPKVKYEDAQNNLIKNQGCMKSLLTGYLDMPSEKKGPRIKAEAQDNFIKNQGTVSSICFKDYGKSDDKKEIIRNYKGRNGSVGELLGNYGQLPMSARTVPRVKPEAKLSYDREGSEILKTLTMQPPTERVKSATPLRSTPFFC
jgi:hypothetical protein